MTNSSRVPFLKPSPPELLNETSCGYSQTSVHIALPVFTRQSAVLLEQDLAAFAPIRLRSAELLGIASPSRPTYWIACGFYSLAQRSYRAVWRDYSAIAPRCYFTDFTNIRCDQGFACSQCLIKFVRSSKLLIGIDRVKAAVDHVRRASVSSDSGG